MKKITLFKYFLTLIPLVLYACNSDFNLSPSEIVSYNELKITESNSLITLDCSKGTTLSTGCSCGVDSITNMLTVDSASRSKPSCACEEQVDTIDDKISSICANGVTTKNVTTAITTAYTVFSAKCSADEFVVGGGVNCGALTSDILASYPSDSITWSASCYELGTDFTPSVYAICIKKTDILVDSRRYRIIQDETNSEAVCQFQSYASSDPIPSGFFLIGGGCNCKNSELTKSLPIGIYDPVTIMNLVDAKWSCSCQNNTIPTSYAICIDSQKNTNQY
jgi:hypothetical protein